MRFKQPSATEKAAVLSTMAAEKAILEFLKEGDEIPDSQLFAASVGIDHTELENVIKSLRGFEIIETQVIPRSFKTLASSPSPDLGYVRNS